ncbi:hypothetical protein AWB80_08152 [Caballeronia pedi]|uniref:Uncharacterized protein n=1 Tax=Caballeronia pedi TaxID=1777141 RepID=A0A158E422_9BURK|nr:phage protein NinX family protein [Caballeronia pedi]SAL01554.1 hypothetical protein AWB80_08152 [Caballeronia pedi]
MKNVNELSGAALNETVALAIGAEKGKTPPENHEATGVPLKFLTHTNPPAFYLVNAAGITTRWNPAGDWAQAGPLLAGLLATGHLLMHPPGEPVSLIQGEKRITGSTIPEAVSRAFVAQCYGVNLSEVPA